MIEYKNLEWLAGLTQSHEIQDQNKAKDIAKSIASNGWVGPAILYSEIHSQAITGVHRIHAAKLLLKDMNDSFDVSVPVIDVDKYIEKYCEENDCTIADLPLDDLELIFADTDIVNDVKENEEYY